MQEQGKYKIGEYTFQTFHEYRDGQEDVRKIECCLLYTSDAADEL